MAKQYEIVIKAQGGGEGYENTLPDNSGGGAGTQGSADNLKAFAKVSAAGALALSAFKWQASLVGRNTGNSDLQQKIDASITLATQGIGIITAFAVGGPVGGALAIAATGLSYAKEIEANTYARRWDNIAIGEYRYRAGPSLNRSRS